VLEKKKYVHRDIKPANILVLYNNNLVLCDFGSSQVSNLTEGTFVGTLPYFAPEIIQDDYSTQSDIYSLGIVIYQLINLFNHKQLRNSLKTMNF